MNAKKQILKMMKQQLKSCEMYCDWKLHSEIEALIAATEAAIFDVPSEDEIRQAAQKIGLKAIALPTAQALAFIDGCNFILNYKKPEHDGK
jgi:hypothetical protein